MACNVIQTAVKQHAAYWRYRSLPEILAWQVLAGIMPTSNPMFSMLLKSRKIIIPAMPTNLSGALYQPLFWVNQC